MSTPPGVIDWGPGEASTVNDFLNTQVGRKWLGYLWNMKPKVTLDKGVEAAALTGAASAGYEHCFSQIASSRATVNRDQMSAKAIDPTKD